MPTVEQVTRSREEALARGDLHMVDEFDAWFARIGVTLDLTQTQTPEYTQVERAVPRRGRPPNKK